MDWTIILGIIFVGLAAIVASISPFVISWLLKQKWVQQAHLEALISALIPQVVEWVEWWAAHWDSKAEEVPPRTTALPPKGEAKMTKALELLRAYIPAAKAVPDEILKLKFETALINKK
jgi:hypothetical protein